MKPGPFVRTRLVRFSDCDPAGISFYPQYFVIFNGLVEDWFNEGLGIGYTQAIRERHLGWPTVHFEVDFHAVSRMGEEVDLSLEVERLGTRSLTLRLRCTGHDGVGTHGGAPSAGGHVGRSVCRRRHSPRHTRCHHRQRQFVELKQENSMKREAQVLLPAGWPRPKGYANGVTASGRQVHVAGMIGWDPQGVFHSDNFGAQVRQALANVVAVLREAGAQPEHIVRMTWYVVDKREYLAAARSVGAAFREIIGVYNAAMTAVEVKSLMEDRARVEIECTAILPE